MLAWTVYFSFIGVGLLMLVPRDNARMARIVALLTAVASFICALAGTLLSETTRWVIDEGDEVTEGNLFNL